MTTQNDLQVLYRDRAQVLDAPAVEDLIAAGRAEGMDRDALRIFRGVATVARLDLGRPPTAGELIDRLRLSNAAERLELAERARSLMGPGS